MSLEKQIEEIITTYVVCPDRGILSSSYRKEAINQFLALIVSEKVKAITRRTNYKEDKWVEMRIKHNYEGAFHIFDLDFSATYEKEFVKCRVVGYEGNGSVQNPYREKTELYYKKYRCIECPICGTEIQVSIQKEEKE